MALMTKEAYLSSLRKLDHRVFIQGERVESVPDHPISRPPAMALAEIYQQAGQEDMRSLFTAQSHLTGETINRFTHIQQSVEDLTKKILMLREMGRKTACCFQRCAGLDCMNTVYAITYDLDQEFGTRYHNRFVDFMKYIQSNDLVPAACMTDTKGDRSLPPSKQEDPDQYMHMVEEKNGGIVVRGAKLHITGAVNSHELLVVPTRALREEDREYAVSFAVPADTKGVTFIYGRQPSDTRRLEDGRSDVGNLYYGGCEAMVTFDDVFVPEERIFMKGEYPITVGTGFSLAEVILSKKEINYTGLEKPDVAIIVSDNGLMKVQNKGIENSNLYMDSKVTIPENSTAKVFDFDKIAGKKGSALCAIALWIEESGLLDINALKEVAEKHKYGDRKSTRLNSSHTDISRMPSSA